jgi:hypothetical protein
MLKYTPEVLKPPGYKYTYFNGDYTLECAS